MGEAISNRLRRIYLPLLAVLLVAWLFRITAFVPNENPLVTATIVVVPGILVAVLITLYYIAAIIIVPGLGTGKLKESLRKAIQENGKILADYI